MSHKNPSFTERQRRMMCADYGRSKKGKKTRTSMSKADLRDFCQKPVVPKSQRKGKWMQKVKRYLKARAKNPHLVSGKWRFIGMFMKRDVPSIKRIFRIHGIKNKITKDQRRSDPIWREIYVTRDQWDISYRAITRLFEGGQAA